MGCETARRLLQAGHTVLLGARDATRGHRAADEVGATFILLDVIDDTSVVRLETQPADGPTGTMPGRNGVADPW